jgi:hypothetical protein
MGVSVLQSVLLCFIAFLGCVRCFASSSFLVGETTRHTSQFCGGRNPASLPRRLHPCLAWGMREESVVATVGVKFVTASLEFMDSCIIVFRYMDGKQKQSFMYFVQERSKTIVSMRQPLLMILHDHKKRAGPSTILLCI